jgi:hypothetical protein
MPYYIYRVRPFAQLTKLAEFAAFTDALQHAKALRTADAGNATAGKVKVMFAETPTQAEDLLCQIREPGPSGDD